MFFFAALWVSPSLSNQFSVENDLDLFLIFGLANSGAGNNLVQTSFCRCVGIFAYKFPGVGELQNIDLVLQCA